MFEKKVDLDDFDKPMDEFYKSTLDQLRRDHNFTIKDSSDDNIIVKFGTWWSARDNKRGSANLRFEEKTNTIDLDFSFFSEIFIATLIIYFPLLFVVSFSAYGRVYIISILMTLVLLGFVKYHHYCFKKTAEKYDSELKNIFYVLDSDEFTFCENCGYELDVGKGSGLERCPTCGSDIKQGRK